MLQIVADHRHLLENVWAIADEVRILDHMGQFPIFDEPSVFQIEGKIPGTIITCPLVKISA